VLSIVSTQQHVILSLRVALTLLGSPSRSKKKWYTSALLSSWQRNLEMVMQWHALRRRNVWKSKTSRSLFLTSEVSFHISGTPHSPNPTRPVLVYIFRTFWPSVKQRRASPIDRCERVDAEAFSSTLWLTVLLLQKKKREKERRRFCFFVGFPLKEKVLKAPSLQTATFPPASAFARISPRVLFYHVEIEGWRWREREGEGGGEREG